MHYYKVLKNGKVIDVLDKLIFIKFNKKHRIPMTCEENDAEAILSSDGNTIWHEESLYNFVDGFDTVKIEEIDEYEYDQLKILHMKSPEEIIDAFVMSLVEDGVL